MADLGLELDRLVRSSMSVIIRWDICLGYISLVGRLCFPSRCFSDESFLSSLCILYT